MKPNMIQRRKLLKYSAAAVVGVPLLAACGGGDGGDSGDIDLSAAYDRVKRGMTEQQVIDAVGVAPNERHNQQSDGVSGLHWWNGKGVAGDDVPAHLVVGLLYNETFSKELLATTKVLKIADSTGGW